MTLSFPDLSKEQAQAFRDHVVAREDALLTDLAHWIHESGGPLEELDGRVDSLIPLWTWAVAFLDGGMPGVFGEAREPLDGWAPAHASRHDPPVYFRSDAVADALTHYLKFVVAQVEPHTYWEVNEDVVRGVPSFDHHATGLWIPSRKAVWVPQTRNVVNSVVAGIARFRANNALHEWYQFVLARHLPEANQLSQESLLAPYASRPLVPQNDPSRIPPNFDEAIVTKKDDARDGGELEISRRERAGDSALSLDRVEVAAGLTAAGFLTDREKPVTPADITDSETFIHGDGIAMATIYATDGVPDVIAVESINATQQTWRPLLRQLKELAARLDADLHMEG